MTTLTATELRPTMQIRLGAIEVLKARGFCQHVYFGANGAVDLIAALWLAENPDWGRGRSKWVATELHMDVLRELDRELGEQSPGLWADAPGRTLPQVIAVLRGVGA